MFTGLMLNTWIAGTVVAAEGSTFRLPETAMGLIPGAGGTVSIPRRIGRWRTLYLALSGRALAAPRGSDRPCRSSFRT